MVPDGKVALVSGAGARRVPVGPFMPAQHYYAR